MSVCWATGTQWAPCAAQIRSSAGRVCNRASAPRLLSCVNSAKHQLCWHVPLSSLASACSLVTRRCLEGASLHYLQCLCMESLFPCVQGPLLWSCWPVLRTDTGRGPHCYQRRKQVYFGTDNTAEDFSSTLLQVSILYGYIVSKLCSAQLLLIPAEYCLQSSVWTNQDILNLLHTVYLS